MDIAKLTAQSRRYWRESQDGGQNLPGLSVLQRESPSEIEAVIYEPVICLILQGRKVCGAGDQSVDLGPGDLLLVSHDLPVLSKITKASPRAPYLALILKLDLGLVRGLYAQMSEAPPQEVGRRSLSVEPITPDLQAALERYLDLSGHTQDAKVLGPALLREIHYRLLGAPVGGMLRNLLQIDSHASRVAKAISLLRRDFHAPLHMAELAKIAGMSATSFHQHFKLVTGTTPLQYQKDLRLIAARDLLTAQRYSVSAAAYAIGYESPTHFSRDYRRKFGTPPMHAAKAPPTSLRQRGAGAGLAAPRP